MNSHTKQQYAVTGARVVFLMLCFCAHAAAAQQGISKQEHLVVPYYMQGARNWCGPASLAMALKYVGVDAEIWEIATGEGKVSEPCGGALDLFTCYQSGATWAQHHEQFVRARYAARNGLETETKTYFLLRSEQEFKNQIKAYISRGYPVMLMSVARLHWIVITGYDSKGVWYHDPSGAFYPACGRGAACLIDAYLPWGVFLATLKSFGMAQLQLFVVKKKVWKTVPGAHRRAPKPTIQMLPELYWEQRTPDGYGACSDCLVQDAGKKHGFAFSFLRDDRELNQYRRQGVMLRADSANSPGLFGAPNAALRFRIRLKVFNMGRDSAAYSVAASVADIARKKAPCRVRPVKTLSLGKHEPCESGGCRTEIKQLWNIVSLDKGLAEDSGPRARNFSWLFEANNACREAPSEKGLQYLHIMLMEKGANPQHPDAAADGFSIPLCAPPECRR
jgi:hypothetical protein